jgi:hypothetical protein
VFIGSHAIAEGVIAGKQLGERSYRRLVHGVYADPALEFDHRLRAVGGTGVLHQSVKTSISAPISTSRS